MSTESVAAESQEESQGNHRRSFPKRARCGASFSRCGASLLDLPDTVILSMFAILRDAYPPRGFPRSNNAEPIVFVGAAERRYDDLVGNMAMKRQGSSCRALASTCVRFRDLFRDSFVSRVEIGSRFDFGRRLQTLKADGDEHPIQGSSYTAGCLDVLKRYARGVRSLSLYPGLLVAYRALRGFPEERGKCAISNSDVDGAATPSGQLRLLFPNLRMLGLHLSVSDITQAPDYIRRDWSGLIIDFESPVIQNFLDKIGAFLPGDLAEIELHIFQETNAEIVTTGGKFLKDLALCNLVTNFLTQLPCLETLKVVDRASPYIEPNPFGRPGRHPTCFRMETFGLLPACYESMEKLTLVSTLHVVSDEACCDLRRFSSLEEFELDTVFPDFDLLSGSLPTSIRSFSFVANQLWTGEAPKGSLDLGLIRSLESLDLDAIRFQERWDAADDGFYISALSSVNCSALTSLRLRFVKSINIDSHLVSHFRDLRALAEIYIHAPIESFDTFVEAISYIPFASVPEIHFYLLLCGRLPRRCGILMSNGFRVYTHCFTNCEILMHRML